MKILSILFTAICSLFLASSVFATDNCSGDTCVEPPELTTSNFGITLESFGGTAGIGEVTWSGADGVGAVEKMSELSLITTLDYAGDACGFNCADSQLTFNGLASERVLTEGIAVGQSPEGTVSVGNASLGQTMLNFEVTISNPAPAGNDNGG